jgi:hypothetical protein
VRPIYKTGVSLASKFCILYIFPTNISTEYFKHAAHSPFFFSKCRLLHDVTFLVPVLFTFYIKDVQNFILKFNVCKSVHHPTIQINHQLNVVIFSVYYPDVCLQLNMFRALSCKQTSG